MTRTQTVNQAGKSSDHRKLGGARRIQPLLVGVLFGTLLLAGCGSTPASNTDTNSSTNVTTNATSNSTSSAGKTSTAAGVQQLLTNANELMDALKSGNQAKVKIIGPKLEDSWSSFEDSVKSKFPDMYDKVEQFLNPTVAGSQVTPIDKQALTQLDQQLIQVLQQLSAKLKG